MTSGQEKQFLELYGLQKKTYDMWIDYWFQYVAGTWQFWVYVAFIIVPLVVLYFYLDRRKAYFLGFYGFCVHMLAAYIDAYATNKGLWGFPYKAVPVLPASFSIDAVLIPVSFMLTYQWALNRNKNYYLYLTLLSVVFSFGLKPKEQPFFISFYGIFPAWCFTSGSSIFSSISDSRKGSRPYNLSAYSGKKKKPSSLREAIWFFILRTPSTKLQLRGYFIV